MASKIHKITINDLVTACLGTAVKEYIDNHGGNDIKKLNIAIPANIRFSHYPTWEDVKFENKFAPVPLTIPLERDLIKSMKDVSQVT